MITAFKKSILATIAIGIMLFVALPVRAQGASSLEVDFESTPLFSELNFLPGNTLTKMITVTNNTESEQKILIEAINATDKNDLGSTIRFAIQKGDASYYDGTLGAFLRGGEVALSALAPHTSASYALSAAFSGDTDNARQETTLGFDLCVGFSGGESHCGDSVIGGEGDTGGAPPSGSTDTLSGTGSGGGGGPITPHSVLEIVNEQLASVNMTTGAAVITWTTNLLSTSQVIYGPLSGAPYQINLNNLPFFGYPLGTSEDRQKVTRHSVTLSGLTPGEAYKFRVVSRASPPTVGYEFVFTFLPGSTASKTVFGVSGSVASASISKMGEVPRIVQETERRVDIPEHVLAQALIRERQQDDWNNISEKEATRAEGTSLDVSPGKDVSAGDFNAQCIFFALLVVLIVSAVWYVVDNTHSHISILALCFAASALAAFALGYSCVFWQIGLVAGITAIIALLR